MSVEAYTAVWDHFEGTQRQRVTMLALANRADEHGIAWPSINELERKTRMKRAGVYEVLRELEASGQLVTLEGGGGRGRTTMRWLKLEGLDGDTTEAERRDKKKGPNSRTDDDSEGSEPSDSAPGGEDGKGPTQPVESVRDSGPFPLIGVKPSVKPSKKTTTGGGDEPTLEEIGLELLDFWKGLTGRNGDTRYTEKRREAVEARLAEKFTPGDLRRAILGCVRSDWHQKRGRWEDRDGEVKDELTSILYDADSVEKLKRIADEAGPVDDLPASGDPIEDLEKAQPEWEAAKQRIVGSVPESTFNLWIQPLEAAGFRNDCLVLVDSAERAIWTNRRYATLIGEALEATGASVTEVEIIDEKTLELEAA